ncbi:MAG: hypothetical protein ACR2RA_26150 [Geminicoccaceae bacterium]
MSGDVQVRNRAGTDRPKLPTCQYTIRPARLGDKDASSSLIFSRLFNELAQPKGWFRRGFRLDSFEGSANLPAFAGKENLHEKHIMKG